EANGSLAGYERCERVTNEELLELLCDILVLAAREDQVTGENAGRIHARVVAEGANGPTSVEADAILADRGILVLPDALTNAGAADAQRRLAGAGSRRALVASGGAGRVRGRGRAARRRDHPRNAGARRRRGRPRRRDDAGARHCRAAAVHARS